MKRMLIVGLLAAVVAVSVGCDPAQTRTWTVQASVLEVGLIAHSEFYPAEVTPMTDEQIQAFGAARVALYEKYGQAVKEGIKELKE
ncbi:MAG TPA: hypothetical protein VNA25_22760 [Phycisphaerae bacterium]|nr:hypothetical protein [Phycisphaerae bacterium]